MTTQDTLSRLFKNAKTIDEYKGKTLWRESVRISDMVEDDYMLFNCNPRTLIALVESLQEAMAALNKMCCPECSLPILAKIEERLGGLK